MFWGNRKWFGPKTISVLIWPSFVGSRQNLRYNDMNLKRFAFYRNLLRIRFQVETCWIWTKCFPAVLIANKEVTKFINRCEGIYNAESATPYFLKTFIYIKAVKNLFLKCKCPSFHEKNYSCKTTSLSKKGTCIYRIRVEMLNFNSLRSPFCPACLTPEVHFKSFVQEIRLKFLLLNIKISKQFKGTQKWHLLLANSNLVDEWFKLITESEWSLP